MSATYPTEEQIEADPEKAVRWAKDARRRWEEEGARNEGMDSGWSASIADACKAGIAHVDRVELVALRELLSRAVPHINQDAAIVGAIKRALQD